MSPAAALGLMLFTGLISGMVGYAIAALGPAKSEVRRMAKQNGFSSEHRRLYKRAIIVLNKIVDASDLYYDTDPLLQRVTLPTSLRTEAEGVINDYRKEQDA